MKTKNYENNGAKGYRFYCISECCGTKNSAYSEYANATELIENHPDAIDEGIGNDGCHYYYKVDGICSNRYHYDSCY